MPELRKDPVVGRWVIIATDRARRPSDFVAEPVRPVGTECVFCEGNEDKTPLEHPHSQLIATPIIPIMVAEEMAGAARYYAMKERCVWCDIQRQERRGGRRTIVEASGFLALAPFAPRFPFETWILPTVHRAAFEESGVDELRNLAALLSGFLRRMNRVLGDPPFNFMLHTAPLRGSELERSEEHTSELQSRRELVCRLLLEKKNSA